MEFIIDGNRILFTRAGETGVVSIVPGAPYPPEEGDLRIGADKSASAQPSGQTVTIDGISGTVKIPFIAKLVNWISFSSRYSTFTQGLFSVSNMVFFLSVAAIFIFLTARRLESRRWS